MKIGDVGLVFIELCVIAWRATARILGTPCLACDCLFTGVVVRSRKVTPRGAYAFNCLSRLGCLGWMTQTNITNVHA